jgi:hypothetical protein
MDFQFDEHSRFCFAIRVGRRCKAKDVVAAQAELTSLYPAPEAQILAELPLDHNHPFP